MSASLTASNTFSFADGNAGHSCNLGSAPGVGDLDVLCVNSDTTVSTPSGFTLRRSDVSNQGAYIFSRKASGGEASTVTVTTAGNFPCVVSWSRWTGTNAFDVSAGTQANASVGGSTPAHSTGSLAETNELVIAFGALHSIGTANQTSPVWSTGFTAVTDGVQGTGGGAVRGYVGYKATAGTAAEAPQVSWSGDGAFDRYMLTAAFTSSGTTVNGAGDRTVADAITGAALVERNVSGTRSVTATMTGAGQVVANASGNRTVQVATPNAASLNSEAVPARVDNSAGWYQLLNIWKEAKQITSDDAASPPIACPNDSEPLTTGPNGELFCVFDGWTPDS